MNQNKKTYEEVVNFDLDYESFTTIEIVAIINFFNLISEYVNNPNKSKVDNLIKAYNTYRNILNSIAFEKKYNKMFEDQTGIKVYNIMKELCSNNK